MITIIDYGMGNLRSVQKACEFLGYAAEISSDPIKIQEATKLILPGVGAFGDAMKHLGERGLIDVIKAKAKGSTPFLGICLGMQLLFDKSFEHGETEGLRLIRGKVVPFELENLKVPHMGWNVLNGCQNPLFDTGNNQYVYFVHTFYASDVPAPNVIATSEYGHPFVAAVQKDNIFGLQFHPEKSGNVGLSMLKRFAEL